MINKKKAATLAALIMATIVAIISNPLGVALVVIGALFGLTVGICFLYLVALIASDLHKAFAALIDWLYD